MSSTLRSASLELGYGLPPPNSAAFELIPGDYACSGHGAATPFAALNIVSDKVGRSTHTLSPPRVEVSHVELGLSIRMASV